MRFATSIIFLMAFAASGADDPFTGIWKLNLQKSKISSPVPLNYTIRIEADEKNIRITQEGIGVKGESFRFKVSGGFDRKDYGVLDSPAIDTVRFDRPDSHTIFGRALKSGNEVAAGTAVLSKDGKSIKISFSMTNPGGKEIKATAVLDRQPDSALP